MSLTNGTRLGPYEILAPIGAGGMGEVYKALDTRLGREVAVKVLPAEFASDPERLRRFEQEARAAAALNHPNILMLHDLGTQNNAPYIVTELLDGETLRQRLRKGAVPPAKAVELGVQIARGLAAAHEKGIVHRDLKPENLWVTKDGRVKILDFGLARLRPQGLLREDGRSEAPTADLPTRSGMVLGTVGYMAPEQARGLPADARTDIFAFGAVLYEMLAGRPPFERGSAVDTLAAILTQEPRPIPGLAPATTRLVERCLRKEASERFQSSTELRVALEAWAAPPSLGEKPSVAVFPFANMTGAKEDDYLCEGLAEEIINELTRVLGLRVIARTSSFAVARMGLDIRESGARLEVGTILEGSVRRSGTCVRVTAQLVATGDGSHILSERYDRELMDVLALEDEIAAAIASRLRVELGRGERPRERSAADPEAHAAYLEGRYHFARGAPDALAKAKECYESAIARDPDFALAYDSLAELYWFLGFFGGVPPREAFSQSTWFALRALDLDDSLAQTHALLGMLRKELDYNWPEVERECRRAIELDPNSPLVRLRYAISGLLPHGRVLEGMGEIERLLLTDPLSIFLRWWLAIFAYLAREPQRVIAEGRHMISLDPLHFLGHWSLGVGLAEAGALEESVSAFQTAHKLSAGAPFTLGFLAYWEGHAGRLEEARQLLSQAEAMAGAGYVPPSTLALCHLGVGDRDEAFVWLDKAIEARDPIIMPIKSFPFLDPLRSDPRFQGLLRKMRLLGN